MNEIRKNSIKVLQSSSAIKKSRYSLIKKTKKSPHKILSQTILRIILIIQTILVGYPLLWNIIASFKSNKEILESPWSLPKVLQFENYINAFVKAKIGYYVLNSILVTIFSMLIVLFLAVPTSYALARYEFKGRKVLQNLYMSGLFIQYIFILVPLFLLMSNLNMIDNTFWLSVVYAVGQLPFTVYLLSSFMKGIPRDYEDAAMIDGCGYFGTLFKVIVPLAQSGIVTVVIFCFFTFWNEYALALVLISSETKKTLPIGLANLMEVQRYATDWGALFAGLVIVLLPTLILYTFTQKKLTEGMQMGGIKG